MDFVSLLISLASGALGGNISGATVKEDNLGTLGNSLVGLLGGGLGHALLQVLGLAGTGDLSLTSIISNIATSGVSGAILPLVVSFAKRAFNKE